VHEHGLHNLIWVWNGQDPAWYPGDARADLLADDPYAPGNQIWLYPLDPARAVRFQYTRRASGSKMIGMSENDTIPLPDMLEAFDARWLFFCTWNREKTLLPDPANQPYGVLRQYSEKYNSIERLTEIYNDPRVLTLDEMGGR
jgi:mannan endo-1,4-beta-mannosidase